MRKMKRRGCFFLVLPALQMLTFSLVITAAVSRPFAPFDDDDAHLQGQIPQSPNAIFGTEKGVRDMGGKGYKTQEAKRELRSNLGSRPPSCEHKCGGCIPCNAIQTPTTTEHLGTLYANYEPEGWKCQCGASFFNP